MKIKSYEDIPFIAKSIIEEIWKQNEKVFETMERKEVVDQIFDFMIE